MNTPHLEVLRAGIEGFLLGERVPPEAARRYAAEAVRQFAVSPACALDEQGRYLGYPHIPQEEGGWVQGGHERRVQISLPPESPADDAIISVDGKRLEDVMRVVFEMNPNNYVTVRIDRHKRPFELSDLGGIQVDAYLYESAKRES